MRKPDRIRTAAALLACAATLLPTLGCKRAPSKAPTPAPSPSPTGEQAEAPPFPAWDSRAAHAAAYADALQPLPEITVEGGSNWYGLTIDGGRIGTDAVATSFTPAEIMDELRRQQPVVEAVMKLSERKDRFPDGSPVVGVEDGIGSNAYRKARLAARLLCADAIRLLGEGKPEDAARRIAAGLNIVRQLSQGSDISSMVARGVFGLTANAIEPMTRGVNGHSLTPAAKETILRSLEALDASAPFGPEMPVESLPQAVEQYARVRTLLTSGSR